jgi:hypothetical protein
MLLKSHDTPLLTPAGPHAMSVAGLLDLVGGESGSERRQQLWMGLAALINYLHAADLYSAEMWVDGSLVTTKEAPNDVDVVIWLPRGHIDQCSTTAYNRLSALLDRPAVRAKYLVDLYFGDPASQRDLDYWQALFSSCRNGLPKGFAAVTI